MCLKGSVSDEDLLIRRKDGFDGSKFGRLSVRNFGCPGVSVMKHFFIFTDCTIECSTSDKVFQANLMFGPYSSILTYIIRREKMLW